jgi:putative methyltransferase (TIGR04325 family)
MIQRAQKLLRRLFIGSGVTGVYPTYAGALAAVPEKRKVGYDNPETRNLYLFLLELSRISDFAALFYLRQLAKPGYRLFDFGGNTGVLYHNYQRRWTMPPNMQWTVCDVPSVTEAGRGFAKTRQSDGAEFHLELRRCRRRRSALLPLAPCSMCPKRWPSSWQSSETRSSPRFW